MKPTKTIDEVERGLLQLIKILKEEVPSLLEVRVFGSYNTGQWNEEKSDIDLYVLIGDENYSRTKKIDKFFDSPERHFLRGKIEERLNGKYSEKFECMFCTLQDLELYGENLKNSMLNGRLLYKNDP